MRHKKNLKKLALIALVLLLAFVAVIVFGKKNNVALQPYYPKATETTRSPSSNTPTPTPTPNSQPIATSTPIASSNAPITISSPVPGATVTSGTHVTGQATVTGVYYRLKGGNSGQLAAAGPITVSGGQFSFDIVFTNDVKGGQDQGTLEVYTLGQQGNEIDIANVNVTAK